MREPSSPLATADEAAALRPRPRRRRRRRRLRPPGGRRPRARPRPVRRQMRHLPHARGGRDDRRGRARPRRRVRRRHAPRAWTRTRSRASSRRRSRTRARPRPRTPSVYMPADLVSGQDAENVAAYVASVAGVPGIEPPVAPGGPGGQVFANNGCGSCHTLEAAGATRHRRPEPRRGAARPGREAGRGVDRRPQRRDRPGLPAGHDAATYGTSIPPDDLKLPGRLPAHLRGRPAEQGLQLAATATSAALGLEVDDHVRDRQRHLAAGALDDAALEPASSARADGWR